jgi:hypothetical protein
MSDKQFDPANHIIKLKGSDYLEVKWRLVWLRDKHPNAVIETELVAHDDKLAIFKATVEIPIEGGEGGGSATGWGSETPGDFRDYIEKAETKAIGRALAALGFGTQFAGYEDGAANDRPVDAPVKRQDPQRQRNVSVNTLSDGVGATQTSAKAEETAPGLLPATERQQQMIQEAAQAVNLTPGTLEAECKVTFGTAVADLNRRDAQLMLDRLNKRRKPPAQAQMIDTNNIAERARS